MKKFLITACLGLLGCTTVSFAQQQCNLNMKWGVMSGSTLLANGPNSNTLMHNPSVGTGLGLFIGTKGEFTPCSKLPAITMGHGTLLSINRIRNANAADNYNLVRLSFPFWVSYKIIPQLSVKSGPMLNVNFWNNNGAITDEAGRPSLRRVQPAAMVGLEWQLCNRMNIDLQYQQEVLGEFRNTTAPRLATLQLGLAYNF